MGTTSKLAGACCLGTLLLACGGRPSKVAAIPTADADAYYALGRVEHAERRFAAAQKAWLRALQLDPAHRDARNGMAVLLAEQGQYDKAIVLWRALAADMEDRPRAERAFLFGNLGYALFLQGARDEALTMLRKACVLDPHEPLTWEHLAAVLEALGETDQALQMMRQARTLRSHDIRDDYARAGGTPAPAPAPPVQGASPWPQGENVARTELRQAGAVIEVVQVRPPAPAPAPRALATPAAPRRDSVRVALEISNGNGAPGMAAEWARRLRDDQWKSVRLTNLKPFAVPVTRIEYRSNVAAGGAADAGVVARALAERLGLPAPSAVADGRADLRIVLGWDQRGTKPAAAPKESAQGTLRAP